MNRKGKVAVCNQIVSRIIVATAIFCVVAGCGKSEEGSTSRPASSVVTQTPEPKTESKRPINDGFGELATSLLQQASTQGLQTDLPANQEALAVLLRVYLLRPDLHKAFGEPDHLNVSTLLQWAAGPGVTVEESNAPTKQKLVPYAAIYTSLAKQVASIDATIYVTLQ